MQTSALAITSAIAGHAWNNPPARLEIPTDFPSIVDTTHANILLDVIAQRLQQYGASRWDKGLQINIAWPHKHPKLYPGHYDQATKEAQELRNVLQSYLPSARVVMADSICETVHLRRSEDQSSLHTLTTLQSYTLNNPEKDDIPLLKGDRSKPSFFIIVDWASEQGTTLAHLRNYLVHNGGTVLCATVPYHSGRIVQKQAPGNNDVRDSLASTFNDVSRNTGRIPEMALAFAQSAQKAGENWTPGNCIEKFEAALNKLGNSVFAMTDGECVRIVNCGFVVGFPATLKKMQEKAAAGPNI